MTSRVEPETHPRHAPSFTHPDPFADTGEDQFAASDAQENKQQAQAQERYVHIRIQQRNGRKTLTTLQGLPKGELVMRGGGN